MFLSFKNSPQIYKKGSRFKVQGARNLKI